MVAHEIPLRAEIKRKLERNSRRGEFKTNLDIHSKAKTIVCCAIPQTHIGTNACEQSEITTKIPCPLVYTS